MKKISWVVLGVCVLLSGGLVGPVVHEATAQELEAVSQQEHDVLLDQAVTPFLEALQTGDVQRLEQLIGGKLALTLGKLLRENTGYPEFLRQRYGGTTVEAPIQIMQRQEANSLGETTGSGQRLAGVQLQTPAGGHDQFQLTLEHDSQGVWKIVDKVQKR